MLIHITQEQLGILLPEFESLRTAKEKLDFWAHRIGHPYIFYLFLTSPYYYHNRLPAESETAFKLRDFAIVPSRNEFEEYNKLVLDQYKLHSREAGYKPNLYDLQNFIDRINARIGKAEKREVFIKYELGKIESFVAEARKRVASYADDKRDFFFCLGYERELLHSQGPDLGAHMYDYVEIIALMNGCTLAKLNKYLVSQLELPHDKVRPKKRISLQQQILLLQFLGIFEKVNAHPTTTNKAIFLSELFNKTPQTIRELYSEGIHSFLTPEARKNRKDIDKDLKAVYELLLLVGLDNEAKRVKEEIDSL